MKGKVFKMKKYTMVTLLSATLRNEISMYHEMKSLLINNNEAIELHEEGSRKVFMKYNVWKKDARGL